MGEDRTRGGKRGHPSGIPSSHLLGLPLAGCQQGLPLLAINVCLLPSLHGISSLLAPFSFPLSLPLPIPLLLPISLSLLPFLPLILGPCTLLLPLTPRPLQAEQPLEGL